MFINRFCNLEDSRFFFILTTNYFLLLPLYVRMSSGEPVTQQIYASFQFKCLSELLFHWIKFKGRGKPTHLNKGF